MSKINFEKNYTQGIKCAVTNLSINFHPFFYLYRVNWHVIHKTLYTKEVKRGSPFIMVNSEGYEHKTKTKLLGYWLKTAFDSSQIFHCRLELFHQITVYKSLYHNDAIFPVRA